ncbi:MAG: lytic transglycosylase domain-containing protein [Betaproteobacteria bacterium]|nr:lytic transglycosylase domain-containing protein [Betaproteobacteria bacterium]
MRFPVRTLLPLILALLASPLHASVESEFLRAREAYQKGRMEAFDKAADKVPERHPLTPYLDYWRLKLQNTPAAKARDFIERHPDSPLANALRAELAREQGRRENWTGFRDLYRTVTAPDQELQCLELRARLVENERAAEVEAMTLWRTSRDLPSACDPIFAALAERGVLTLEERLLRLRLALDAGNLRLARELDARLPEEQRMSAGALGQAAKHAGELVAEPSDQRGQREAALYALTTLAKSDPAEAAALWEKHQARYSENEQRYGWGQIAMHAARKHDPQALAWFTRAGASQSDLQAQWRARANLRAGRWLEVFNAIEAMSPPLREEAVWRYWKARALKAMNASYPANMLFARLSQEISYYGLLATEELPPRVESRPADHRVTPDELKAAQEHPGLTRALLLREYGDHANALAEWAYALRGMDDRKLLAAAELALREKWHDRAIVTASQTRELHSLDLRFISPFRDLATAYAQENNLDEAWVYGLMRQESRFVEHARSVVGARGLMQIMPGTAKWIAKQLGLSRNAHAKVGEPETNIRFGTYYLKRIYESLSQSPVLASAGYNAGPLRARKWQADTALEGAVYVESIPFSETREYVKKVLANAMYYRTRFGGETRPLKDRLGVIPPRVAAVPEGADETSPAP